MHNKQKFNRTFARRIGKTLSKSKKIAIENDLPHVIYSHHKLKSTKYNKISLEIGYGMGEHFVHAVKSDVNCLHIGVEVYLNGVANVLNNLQDHTKNNYLLWPDDLDEVLEDMPDQKLDTIYVLFPDPWHKRRYFKKRLFNIDRVNLFKQKLVDGGVVHFVSDIEDYFHGSKMILETDKDWNIISSDFLSPYPGYIRTKYHNKAVMEGRVVQFISAICCSASNFP